MRISFSKSSHGGASSCLPSESRGNGDCAPEMTTDLSSESEALLPQWRARRSLPLQVLFITSFLLSVGFGQGVSVGKRATDNSVEAQLNAFRVHDDFEVNLFADESMGIANPIAMHWDEHGRLWVLTTLTYAQLEPGERPSDTLVILEDTDKDGRADKSTVFADGLDMPMGFALSRDGVYLGEGPDLLLLKDSDGDDKADVREVVLTGFGTGDTHQNISNFTWGPDRKLYFSQGLHCYSRVETPWGIVRGDTAGFWRFDPETLKLEPFCFPSLCTQNPCGIVFDKTGALFIKSNNKELIFATPGLVPTTHQNNLVPVGNIGSTPGKSMGGEYVDSPHLPDWIQNNILIAGYYSNRVSAFALVPEQGLSPVEESSGYAKVEPVEVLHSSHGSFRPVEIRIGPDGAIYVADWFNPIIGHYQASLRHPDRDEEHGRIWRITAKGRELKKPNRWPQTSVLDSSDVEDKIPAGMWGENLAEWMKGRTARQRLDLILAAANSGEANALAVALTALDYPRDRFIDYSLEQTVHALAPLALPRIKSGSLPFEKPEHLAYFLETLGGEEARGIARKRLKGTDLSEAARQSLGKVLARSGTPEDLNWLLETMPNAEILAEMAAASDRRKTRPKGKVAEKFAGLMHSPDSKLRIAAIYLAGSWELKELSPRLRELAADTSLHATIRGEAVGAISKLEGARARSFLLEQLRNADIAYKPFLVSSLVSIAPVETAGVVLETLETSGGREAVGLLVGPFFRRNESVAVLMEVLKDFPQSAESAQAMVSAMSAAGQNNEQLLGVLHDKMGLDSGARAYSSEFVAALVAEVEKNGNAEAGKEIYLRAELTCVACHQIGGQGGIIGPSLDTVGAGLSPDLLVESVLWPQRQLKEGYFSITVNTKGGDVFSGYREGESDGVFRFRDMATGTVRELPRKEITKIDNTGSLMPQGLTNGLSREELRDLIAYLASLRG